MKHVIIKDFLGFLNESVSIREEATAPEPTSIANVKFNFQFETGKYLQSDIPAEQLLQLKKDLAEPIRLVRVPQYRNQVTTLTITASTSTLGLSADLKSKLQSAGYKSSGNGNDALCAARLKTLEDIVIAYMCEKLKCTPEEFAKKVTINKVSKPNAGGGNTEEERKKFQYISMALDIKGNAVPAAETIVCNMTPQRRKGIQAGKDVNYVGYSNNQFIKVGAGVKLTINLNPLSVPDMVYFKYKDTEFLSPWLGSKSGSSRNFEAELNDTTKLPGLTDAINSEIAKVGGKLTVQTALAKNGGLVNGKFVVLPGPQQGGKAETFAFTIEKGFSLDELTVRVFAPLSGTEFEISTKCNIEPKPATT